MTVTRRVAALIVWSFAAWVLLTWTLTASQLLFGLGIAVAVAIGCAPLGEVATPWGTLEPCRFVTNARLVGSSLVRIVRANLSLSRRIWSPSRPLRSGMLIVPTDATSDAELTAVGVVSSLIVDNQLVDLDRRRHELQYHSVSILTLSGEDNRGHVNGPIERWVCRRPAGRTGR